MIRTDAVRPLVWLAVALLGVNGGCAQHSGPRDAADRTYAAPLNNFGKVSDVLYRGAQPDAGGFAALKRIGVQTVINLRHDHRDFHLVAGLGLRNYEIRSLHWEPKDENMIKFLAIVEIAGKHMGGASGDSDPESCVVQGPVFVHCAAGEDRTGCAVAVYRIVEEKWPVEAAIQEMRAFHYNWWFPQIISYLRGFDGQKVAWMQEQVQKQAVPPPDCE